MATAEASQNRYREIGLSAVAIELHLQLNTLDPDVSEAVERGIAALSSAGSEPGSARVPRSVRAGEDGGRRKTRRVPSQARQSPRFPKAKARVVKLADGAKARP